MRRPAKQKKKAAGITCTDYIMSTKYNTINLTMSTAANQDDQLPTAGKKGGTAISKLIIGTILIGFIAYVIYDSASGEGRVTDTVDDFLQWVEDNPTEGVFAFIGVYFVATGRSIMLVVKLFELDAFQAKAILNIFL